MTQSGPTSRPSFALALTGGLIALIAGAGLYAHGQKGAEVERDELEQAPLAKPSRAPTPKGTQSFEAVVPAEDWVDFSPGPSPLPRSPKAHEENITVQVAAARSCSTSSVDGLSQQLIAEMRSLAPQDLTQIPDRPNLTVDRSAFLFLEANARKALVAALDSNRSRTMRLNSAFRTLAQQYLVSEWAAAKRCGVTLAASPGTSNHETGLAIDLAEPQTWRKTLEAHGFRWMGKADPVHFDYVGRTSRRKNLDVLAFQRLWNRHHGDDMIAEDGQFGASTRERLRKAPARGFRSKTPALPSGG